MKTWHTSQISLVALFLVVTCSTSVRAQENNLSTNRDLNEHLKPFEPYVGIWTCDSNWTSGGSFWAQNTYSIGMNGNFFNAATSTKNSSGGVYQRYQTTWVYDKDSESLKSYGFSYDGTVIVTSPEIETPESGHPIIRSVWQQPEGTYIKQEVQMNDDFKSYAWRVWSSEDQQQWTEMMNGVWLKK